MIRQLNVGMGVLAVALISSGCVSSSKFEKMQAEKNEEIKTLQQRQTALEQDNAALRDQIGHHMQENAIVQKRVSSLKEQNAAMAEADMQRQREYDALVMNLTAEVQKGELQINQYKDMLSVDLADQVFFDSGRATLKPEGKKVLRKIGDTLKGYENKLIRVVGYTDNVPVAKALQNKFPTNWELSVERATTVVRFLQDVGVPPDRMVASGRGEYSPVASNDTPEGRQKNRRIEIVLIDQRLVDELNRSTN